MSLRSKKTSGISFASRRTGAPSLHAKHTAPSPTRSVMGLMLAYPLGG